MSEIQKKKVGPHLTQKQKSKLICLLQENPLLRSGKFNANYTQKDAVATWQHIAVELNAMPGANKEWQAWRKTWQDIYSKIKAKQAVINRSRRQTGGGTPPPPLTPFEETVSSLINPKVVSGHEESEESAVVFNFDSENISEDCVVYQIINSEEGLSADQIARTSTEQTAGSSANPTARPSGEPATTRPQRKRKINMKTLLKDKYELKKQYNKEKLEILREKNQKLENIHHSILVLANALRERNARTD